MGRIATIESIAASGLPRYNNLKVIVRGRPRFIDPQLDGGNLRFAVKRGFNFSAIIPDNQAEITEDVYKDSYRITMGSRPTWMGIGTLVRLGNSEAIGEMHIVQDTIDVNAIDVYTPIVTTYSADPNQSTIPVVSLVGTPCNVYTPTGSPDDKKMMTIDSWYKIVPYDALLLSQTPDILESLQEYSIKRADLFGTRSGNSGIGEPATVYQYHIELNTKTGLLPFIPSVGLRLYLKALPLYFRGEWGTGDIEIPPEIGPCLVDAFYGSLLNTNTIKTELGIQTWDAFGQQANLDLAGDQQWQNIPENYLILERPITSDSLLFWQRIMGNFQYQKAGYFQAELTSGDGLDPVDFVPYPATDLCITAIPHRFITGEQTQVVTTGILPSGILAGVYYYIIVITPTTFKLADTRANALAGIGIIDITDIGSGSHSCIDPNIGKFCFSSNLLVPKWPSDHEYGWVIPLFSRSAVRCVVQFEPQEPQVFEIPSNTLTFIRPHVKVIYNSIMTGNIPLIVAGDYIITAAIDFTAEPTTDVCTTNINHGLSTGAKIQLTTTGSLPSGLSLMTDYYVIVDSPTTFSIADTLEHAKAGTGTIDITSIGSGLHRCSNPNVNFLTKGLKAGHFFSSAGTKWEIINVTVNTFTLVGGTYPTTTVAAAYEIFEKDLTPIDRIVMSFKGSPNSRVEIRDWQYDGTMVTSLSYYILGTKEAYGQKRWLAGGFNVKPLFYNLAVLKARYSDGVSRYNSGHTYV